jgi:hypothetical protein
MAVWHAPNFQKSVPNGHYFLQRAAKNKQFAEARRALKTVKALHGLISRL